MTARAQSTGRGAFDPNRLVGGDRRVLSRDEEAELGRRIQGGDKGAVDTLIRHNLAWGWQLAIAAKRKYRIDESDALWLVMEGLRIAAERFDPSVGAKFSTYSKHWIRSQFSTFSEDLRTAYRVPRHAQVLRLKSVRGKVTDLTPFQADALAAATVAMESVSIEDETPDGRTVGSRIESRDAEPSASVIAAEDVDRLRSAIGSLPPRLRQVIESRYGIGSADPMTLDEVGQALGGLTRQRVLQIQNEALAILAKHLRRASRTDSST